MNESETDTRLLKQKFTQEEKGACINFAISNSILECPVDDPVGNPTVLPTAAI